MILVIGAPRTGTTSVSRALENLGLSVFHFCPLTNRTQEKEGIVRDLLQKNQLSKSLLDFDVLCSWRLLENYSRLGAAMNPKKVIILTREYEDWAQSMACYGFNESQIRVYRTLTFLAFDFFAKKSLRLSVSDGITYEQLKDYLGIASSLQGEIPHLNKQKEHYQI